MPNLDRSPSSKVCVTGRVEKLFFSCPTFTAGVLEVPGELPVRFAGKFLVQLGDEIRLHGEWTTSKDYGPQLTVSAFEYDLPADIKGLAHYIARHPRIKGIGPAKARVLAEQFGEDFDCALVERAEEVAKAIHVPLAVIENLRSEWQSSRSFNLANTWLASFELTHHQITTLVQKYGNSVIAVFQEDPYQLIREVEGYGFKRVDKIARKMGTPKDHPSRIRGAILHCMAEELSQGNCWIEFEELVEQSNTLLVMDTLDSRDRIREGLDRIVEDRLLACEGVGNRFLVAFPHIRRMEAHLAEIFARGASPNPHFGGLRNLAERIAAVAPELNTGQRSAILSALEHSITVMTGGAGVGKTFSVLALCRLYDKEGLRVILCAPTGKAAKRMEESTGRSASTIHRLLGYDGRDFRIEGPLNADLLVVDEASMCDVPLLWHLLRAVDLARTSVVLVGDHNQLPPVGPGNVLRDLITTRVVPVSMLTEVVRQAGILKENCNALLSGRVAGTAAEDGREKIRPWYRLAEFGDPEELEQFVYDLYGTRLQDHLGLDLVRDVQLLTPTRKGLLGVAALNLGLQALIQKKLHGRELPPVPANRRPPLYPGDKVIMRKNTYALDLMNGSVGQVTKVDPKSGNVTAVFDGREVLLQRSEGHLNDLDLAYALTIHQTQGSEFPVAIVIIHKSHSFQHHRNMLYTGATRAKRSVILLGDHWGIRNCASKVQVNKRRTWLSLIAGQKSVPPPPVPMSADSENTLSHFTSQPGVYGSGGRS